MEKFGCIRMLDADLDCWLSGYIPPGPSTPRQAVDENSLQSWLINRASLISTATKVTLRAMREVQEMQINPELEEYRVSASAGTDGKSSFLHARVVYSALNPGTHHLMPVHGKRQRKTLPFIHTAPSLLVRDNQL